MKKKIHAPRKQLKEVSKAVKELSIARGLRGEVSFIDEITQNTEAPLLPGLPPYLPHRWTIKASQRMMFDLLSLWKLENEDEERQENITEFFKFVIKEFDKQIKRAEKEVKEVPKLIKKMEDVPVLSEVFAPLQKKTTTKALQKFYVDSFAIAVIVRQNDTVSDYAEWFLTWTEELDKFWSAKEVKQLSNDKAKI